jgi:hypothetical protein
MDTKDTSAPLDSEVVLCEVGATIARVGGDTSWSGRLSCSNWRVALWSDYKSRRDARRGRKAEPQLVGELYCDEGCLRAYHSFFVKGYEDDNLKSILNDPRLYGYVAAGVPTLAHVRLGKRKDSDGVSWQRLWLGEQIVSVYTHPGGIGRFGQRIASGALRGAHGVSPGVTRSIFRSAMGRSAEHWDIDLMGNSDDVSQCVSYLQERAGILGDFNIS